MTIFKPLNESTWTRPEMKVIAKHAGKLSISEITVLVNEVSVIHRTNSAVEGAGRKSGWRFGLKIA